MTNDLQSLCWHYHILFALCTFITLFVFHPLAFFICLFCCLSSFLFSSLAEIIYISTIPHGCIYSFSISQSDFIHENLWLRIWFGIFIPFLLKSIAFLYLKWNFHFESCGMDLSWFPTMFAFLSCMCFLLFYI